MDHSEYLGSATYFFSSSSRSDFGPCDPSGSTSSFRVRATRVFFTRTRRESAPGKNATSLATTETTTTNQHAVRAATAPAAATQSSKSTMPKYEKALTTQNRKKMLIVMLYLLSGQGAG